MNRVSLHEGRMYRVLKPGAKLIGESFRSVALPSGAEIRYIGGVMGWGSDNVTAPNFEWNGRKGEFSPLGTYNSISDEWLEPVARVAAMKNIVKDFVATERAILAMDHSTKSFVAAEIAVGDVVKMSSTFLRSTGQYTGDIGRVTGKVVAISPLGGMKMAEVEWDGDAPRKVNVKNLVLKSRMHLEPA